MLVTPRPGTNRENLRTTLDTVRTDASNLRGAHSGNAYDRLLKYLDWATGAVRSLSYQISDSDISRLILTRRYEALLAGAGHLAGTEQQRFVNGVVSLELDERVAALDEAIKALDELTKRWGRRSAFVVADSSLYIEHTDKLEDLDLAPVCSLWEEPIRLIVPMVVVDELDGLKQNRRAHVRWRAGYTLAVLDRLFADGMHPAVLRREDFSALGSGGIPRGEVTIELLFDPPGHTRLPIADDEIIDRALAVQGLAGQPVALLTYDTGQATRARAAGLKVVKLRDSAGEGDEPPRK